MDVTIRAATPDDLAPLAALWHDGWHDAHVALAPVALTRQRTPESFVARLQASLSLVRVSGPTGAPLGFHLLKDDEVNQFYVAAAARGTGLAAALMADAEARLRRASTRSAAGTAPRLRPTRSRR